MKKIINGKVYNTETAEFVAQFGNGLPSGDFRNFDEALWKTKKGAWFLAGEGGAMTKYSQPCGDMTGGGSDLIPLSNSEALAWLESHDEVKAIEEHFLADLVEA